MIPALIKIDASKESPTKDGCYFTVIKHPVCKDECAYNSNFIQGKWSSIGQWVVLFWYKEVFVHTEEEVKEAFGDGLEEYQHSINAGQVILNPDDYYNEKFKKI